MNLKPQQSAVLIGKRLVLALKGSQSNTQITEDAKNLSDTIQALLTKIELQQDSVHISLLKRLHLVPEQLRSATSALVLSPTNTTELLEVVTTILQDLNTLKMDESALVSALNFSAPASITIKRFSIPKSGTETTLCVPALPIRNRSTTTTVEEKDELMKVEVEVKPKKHVIDENFARSGNLWNDSSNTTKLNDREQLDRIETKMEEVFHKMNEFKHKQDDSISRGEVQNYAKAQLQKISNLRTSLHSTRRMTQKMLADTLSTITSSRDILLNIKKPKKVESFEETIDSKHLSLKIRDFGFLLESVRHDLTKGSRPGHLYQTKIKEQLSQLSASVAQHRLKLDPIKRERNLHWEKDLQTIISEQQLMSDAFVDIDTITEQWDQITDLANLVVPVLDFQANTSRELKRPEMNVISAEKVQEYGMGRVLLELAMRDDTANRLDVDTVVERLKRVVVREKNPFEAELSDYVGKRLLRI